MCKWGTYKEIKLCKAREVSGRFIIPVDSCLADLIQVLNDANIETTTSCCGHGKGDGEIILRDGRILRILRAAGPDK